ncbi:hypothetical protein [Pandoravirus japonicus]|uniref:Transmembrane protein n=1 Tax=Pandoravirus japonicus TaxID=2823154 RepID=A0A811BNJ6_9VIRU|nr:hypothetical protein [Pandoravirus japonicus]
MGTRCSRSPQPDSSMSALMSSVSPLGISIRAACAMLLVVSSFFFFFPLWFALSFFSSAAQRREEDRGGGSVKSVAECFTVRVALCTRRATN